MSEIQLALLSGVAIGSVLTVITRPLADYIYWRINRYAQIKMLDKIDHAKQDVIDAQGFMEKGNQEWAIHNLSAAIIALGDVLEQLASRR